MSKARQRKVSAMQKKNSATKKSSVGIWDELKVLHTECDSMRAIPARVAPLLRNPEALKVVKDINGLKEVAGSLAADMKDATDALKEIYDEHKELKGDAKTPDDYIKALTIGESYQNWLMRYHLSVEQKTNVLLTMFVEEDKPIEQQVETVVEDKDAGK